MRRRFSPVLTLLSKAKVFAADFSREFREAQVLLAASSLAYITILSIIPALALSFAIFQAFGGMEKLYSMIEPIILENLAEGSSEEAMQWIRGFIKNVHTAALGAGGLVGIIVTCMSMLNSIENTINRIWQCERKRPLFFRISYYWLIITLGPLALAIAIGIVTSSHMPLSNVLPSNTGVFLLTVAIFFMTYKWTPTCKVSWKSAGLSSIVVAILWNLARIAYSFYTSKAVQYNKIYGSLSAVPILLVWIYILWIIVLGGAALSATLQRRFGIK